MRPISVASPVATTTPRALAVSHQRARIGHAAAVADAAASAATGAGDLLDRHGFAGQRRFLDAQVASPRAGADRPAPCRRRRSNTMSPGTRSAASISWRWPSRSTMACSDSMLRMASRRFSALPSWMKPMIALMTTTPRSRRIDPVPEQRRHAGGAEQHVDEHVVELEQEAQQRPALRRRGSRLGPCCARRRAASAAHNPALSVFCSARLRRWAAHANSAGA